MKKQNKITIKKETKISYNPFKMWGSYVGAILYLIFTLPDFSILFYPIRPFVALIEKIYPCGMNLTCLGPVFATIIISTLILGFLIGWGIHSLFRYLKNKKGDLKYE